MNALTEIIKEINLAIDNAKHRRTVAKKADANYISGEIQGLLSALAMVERKANTSAADTSSGVAGGGGTKANTRDAITVQINGKNRGSAFVKQGADQRYVEDAINVRNYLLSNDPTNEVYKVIFVPGRLINYMMR